MTRSGAWIAPCGSAGCGCAPAPLSSASTPVNIAASIDSNGEILERQATRNDVTGGWRAVVRFRRLDAAKPVELRANLVNGNEIVSETWSYILPPE